MKKLFLTIAIATAAVLSMQAQGLVKFNNNNFSKILTNSAVGGDATGLTFVNSGVNSYYFALFYSAAATTVGGSSVGNIGLNTAAATNSPSVSPATYAFQDGAWTSAGLLGTNTSNAGRFGSTTPNASGDSIVNGVGQAANAQFVIVGWSANIGNTLASLIAWYNNGSPTFAGWVGESAVTASLKTGDGGSTTTPNIMGNVAGQAPTFTLGLVPTPEPGTMALAALGGASLLLFRRRK